MRKRTKNAEEEEERCCIKTALDNDKEARGCRREKRCGEEEDRQSSKEKRRSEKVEAKGVEMGVRGRERSQGERRVHEEDWRCERGGRREKK